MYVDKLFLGELPQPLLKEVMYELIEQANEGSKDARDKLVIHNIRLVLYEVLNKFRDVDYDKKDLISIGNIGLLKAISAFDISKGYEFSTFAKICIDNEILMFLRKIKNEQKVDSFENVVFRGKDESELKLEDSLSDESNLVEDYETFELYHRIRELLKHLPDRDREIVMLYFGFYNNRPFVLSEIAERFCLSIGYISRIIANSVKKLGEELEATEHIVLPKKPQARKRNL